MSRGSSVGVPVFSGGLGVTLNMGVSPSVCEEPLPFACTQIRWQLCAGVQDRADGPGRSFSKEGSPAHSRHTVGCASREMPDQRPMTLRVVFYPDLHVRVIVFCGDKSRLAVNARGG